MTKNSEARDARLSAEVGVSPFPRRKRVKKAGKNGYIQTYVARLLPGKEGKHLTHFISISLTAHQPGALEAFARAARRLPEAPVCHHISGEDDFPLKVMVFSLHAYCEFLVQKLTPMKYIAGFQRNGPGCGETHPAPGV